MSDSKICRNVFPCQQIKNCLSSLYQTLSTAIFASTLFMTKIMCCCVTHDATSSTLVNSTNEANTFLTVYNIIRFSRLSKLVSSLMVANGMEHNSYTSFAAVNIVGMRGGLKLPDKPAPCSSLFQHLGGPKNFTATVAFGVVRSHQEKPRMFVG